MYSSHCLKFAALYNLIWGSFIVLWPAIIFDLAGLKQPLYPGLWQCIGMIVGVYGIGYWIASHDYKTHWPIVLVGFLGKIFGPIGFLMSLYRGEFNLAFGTVIIFNDLIWWVPFALILADVFKAHATLPDQPNYPKWQNLLLPDGTNLVAASCKQNIILVLVRHQGCTFCRESISLLSKYRRQIINLGFEPILVHMGSTDASQSLRTAYGLEDLIIISDPDRLFYQSLSLQRGSWRQLFGLRIWWRGLVVGIIKRRGVGKLVGDGFQLGGVFLILDGNLKSLHLPKDAADMENWPKILSELQLERSITQLSN